MKVISYNDNGTHGVGVMTDETNFVSLSAAAPDLPNDLRAILEIDPGLDKVRAAVDSKSADMSIADVTFDPLIREPHASWALALNYKLHIEETGLTTSMEYPQIFLRMPICQVGHGENLWAPRLDVAEAYDYEGELAVIIGKPGRHIPADSAFDYIAGYTIINEGSVRDWQRRGTQNSPGKNFYRSGAIGPWMVTADEIADTTALRIITRVDGEVRQDGGTDMMIFDIPYLIAHISTFTWLEPGDLIATGSPGGSAIEDPEPRWLRAGQQVEVEIAPIGVLANPVRDE